MSGRIFGIGFNSDKKIVLLREYSISIFTFDTGIFTYIIPNYLQKRLKNTAPVYLQDFTNCFHQSKKGALVIMHEVFSASCLLTRFEQFQLVAMTESKERWLIFAGSLESAN